MKSKTNPLMVLIAATAGATLVPINTSMLSVGLSPIMNAFGVSPVSVTWLVLLYLVVITSLQPTAGKLGDRFGHRRVFMLGLLSFGAVSFGAAVAPTFPLLVLFRVLQGMTASTLGPNASALIRLAYPPDRQGRAMGLYVGAFSMGLTLGPVVGALLVTNLGWRSIFWVNLPLVLFSIWVGLRTLPASGPAKAIPFDWQGTGIFTFLIGLVVVALNLTKEGGLPVPAWVVLLVVLVLAALFYRTEQRASDPLVRFDLFRLRGFGASNVAVFLMHSMLYVYLVAVPLYIQEGRHLPATTSGVQMAVFSLMQVLVAPISGRLSDSWGRRPMVVLGGVLYLASGIIIALLQPHTSVLVLLVALILAGTGTGMASAPIQATALGACPPEDVGTGSGVWYTSRYLGNITGALLAGLLMPANLSGGAAHLFWTVASIAVALTLSAGFMPSRQPAAVQQREALEGSD